MKDIRALVEARLAEAAQRALGLDSEVDPLVRAAKDPRHGDYQANLAMPLAKKLGTSPRALAERVADELRADPHLAVSLGAVSVAGPGFLNVRVSPEAISACAVSMLGDEKLGVDTSVSHTVVLDYSSPNLAKEMHVGHLRSTVIGDALFRVLSFRGDRVIRQNHVGDWGTQFGMLLEHLLDTGWTPENSTIRDLNALYQEAKARFDAEPDFKERARERVVSLQQGEEESRKLWRQLIGESVRHMNEVYRRLAVSLVDADLCPESFYNDRLPTVVSGLRELGLLCTDDDAQVVFPDGYHNKDGEPLPLIVQKRDGGFGYAATDLAAGRYRVETLKADRVIYVVDARQADHFGMVFWTLRAAQWAPAECELAHVAFGTILGADKKPFKTRAGGTVRLVELLDEAERRALAAVTEKNPELPEAERRSIARAIGMGAVKYADLSSERIKDYVFDYDRMLALEGNTAPYLQYAIARIRSIFREGGLAEQDIDPSALRVEHDAERALVLELLKWPRVVASVADSLEPHRLTNHLYDVAAAYHHFHNRCRVLKAESAQQRSSRLAICRLAVLVLGQGLALLGIETPERM